MPRPDLRACAAAPAALLAILILIAVGCGRSPEARKARHLERGDTYFTRDQYREALIEYANALRIDSRDAHTIRQLGLAHYQLGELALALPFLVKSKEHQPENTSVRLKLATIHRLARRLPEARQEVTDVLQKDPKNFEAILLSVGMAVTAEEVDAAIRQLEAARSAFGDRVKYHLALGTLHARKRDALSAERAFQDAVAKDPKSVEAHTLLGGFYLAMRDTARAEREFRAAADASDAGSPARLKLAEFYLAFQKVEEGKRILAEMTQKAPKFLPAWYLRAELALAERKYDESVQALEGVFKNDPSNLHGRFLRGRVHLARGGTTEAIEEFQKIVKTEPRFGPARYQLALAHLRRGDLHHAKAELTQATSIDPKFTDAALLQAELDVQARAYQIAVETLEKLVANHPGETRAYVVLGLAYLGKREPVKAVGAFRKIVALAPRDPRGPHFVGVALRAMGKSGEARKEFEASLAMAPGFVDPLIQLVGMAVAERAPDVALERVRREVARVPQSAALHHLLGQVHLLRGEPDRAEVVLLKAIELDRNLIAPYLEIGQVYATSGMYDQALEKVSTALKLNPKNVAARMLAGVIYERKGDIPKAIEAYEHALGVEPRFAPAANNVAYLYAEYGGGDKDKALELAQRAREAAPEEPHIADTLGWILYKRGVHQRALSLLKESATKLSDNPEVQYHLGMAYLKVGDDASARQALRLAAGAARSFAGKDEARKVLARLK